MGPISPKPGLPPIEVAKRLRGVAMAYRAAGALTLAAAFDQLAAREIEEAAACQEGEAPPRDGDGEP